MLREDPKARPNIYQVMREVCAMRGTDVPIKDVSPGAIISLLQFAKIRRSILGGRNQKLDEISTCQVLIPADPLHLWLERTKHLSQKRGW